MLGSTSDGSKKAHTTRYRLVFSLFPHFIALLRVLLAPFKLSEHHVNSSDFSYPVGQIWWTPTVL